MVQTPTARTALTPTAQRCHRRCWRRCCRCRHLRRFLLLHRCDNSRTQLFVQREAYVLLEDVPHHRWSNAAVKAFRSTLARPDLLNAVRNILAALLTNLDFVPDRVTGNSEKRTPDKRRNHTQAMLEAAVPVLVVGGGRVS